MHVVMGALNCVTYIIHLSKVGYLAFFKLYNLKNSIYIRTYITRMYMYHFAWATSKP